MSARSERPSASMRFLLVGGPSGNAGDSNTDEISRQLGRSIAEGGHELAVCSSYPGSVDLAAFEGFVEAGGPAASLFVFTPANPASIEQEWGQLLARNDRGGATLQAVAGPDATEEVTRSNAYLLAQLAAMSESHVIVAVGGSLSGSAIITLSLAESRGVRILPFDVAGGAASESLRASRQALAAALGDGIGHLYERDGWLHAIKLAAQLRSPSKGLPPYVFVSHAWLRPAETDRVEVELTRLGVRVFRDERRIDPGADIPAEIRRALDACTHFVGIWCAEYACSPHCYDEYHHVAKRKLHDGALGVLMLRVDDTRLVWQALRPAGVAFNWPRIEERSQLRAVLEDFLGLRPGA